MSPTSTAVALARAGIESWNAHDRERLRAGWAPDAVLVEHATGREAHGPDAIADVRFSWLRAFPDGHAEVVDAIDAGDVAVMRVVWSGTQTGPLASPDGGIIPPTGRAMSVDACLVLRVRGDRVVREDHYFDLMGLMDQLGALPAATG